MIEQIKEKIWALLKGKEVSLAMIFSHDGGILWHRGRKILDDKQIRRGGGYCSTWVFKSIREGQKFRRERCSAAYPDLRGFDSAHQLDIKSLVILPLDNHYFLYLDSGTKKTFDNSDVSVFDSLGSLLGSLIRDLRIGGHGVKNFSGGSGLADQIREKIIKFAIEEDPVLLLGETGVGKSMVAEMIHRSSGRSGSFVVVNTPGIPDTLLEAQLFGHRKGAFSGAVGDHEGLVTAAEGGTLFLDEIAELETSLQAKLLRFIDTRMYYRLGENRERQAGVRIIAATNQDLLKAMADKRFREDLFFRLNCLRIEIPPLRERQEDILGLIEKNRGLLRGKTLSPEAQEMLLGYDWPGNVRELIQVLKAVGIQFERDPIGREIDGMLTFHSRPVNGDGGKVEVIWRELCSGQPFWKAVKEPFLRHDISREEAKEIINRGLQQTKGRYVGLVQLFNLKAGEYKNFMSFLYANRLR